MSEQWKETGRGEEQSYACAKIMVLVEHVSV